MQIGVLPTTTVVVADRAMPWLSVTVTLAV